MINIKNVSVFGARRSMLYRCMGSPANKGSPKRSKHQIATGSDAVDAPDHGLAGENNNICNISSY